jgi:hypothetical protein
MSSCNDDTYVFDMMNPGGFRLLAQNPTCDASSIYFTRDKCLCCCDEDQIAECINFDGFVQHLQNLTSLELHNVSMTISTGLETLKHLTLIVCNLEITSKFNLESLTMKACIRDPKFKHEQIKDLKKLHIDSCQELSLSTEHMHQLEDLLMVASYYVKVKLDKEKIHSLHLSDLELPDIISFLTNNKVIRSLSITTVIDSPKIWFDALATCCSLERLDIYMIQGLPTQYKFLDRLKSLTLRGQHGGIDNFLTLNSQVEELVLDYHVCGAFLATLIQKRGRKFKKGHFYCMDSEVDMNKTFHFVRELHFEVCPQITSNLDLPFLTKSFSSFLNTTVVKQNIRTMYTRRFMITLLLCLKPKDVLFSIAKEIKSWE